MISTNNKLTVQSYQLAQRQALPLEQKIILSQKRIKQWYEEYEGKVYVAFSGGKDSTVLLDIVRDMYPEVPGVFVDTGLEYPEIKQFVKSKENIRILRPAKSFKAIIDQHGYPVISKQVADAIKRIRSPGCSQRTKNKALYGDERGSYGRLPKRWRFLIRAPFKISDRCCEIMKIRPVQKLYKLEGMVGYVGTMAADSNKRMQSYLKHGCFLHNKHLPKCTPLGFWTSEDVWHYIKSRNIEYCSVYDTGITNTGCIYCCFGVHLEEYPNRFECLLQSHPQLWDYCINKLGIGKVLNYIGVSYGQNLFTQTNQRADEETEDQHSGHGPQARMPSRHAL
jgi:3'-phosphoadenosine 5'-phosphosulfate sulfotransferase (PAPS reductase)/FAD synthetase